MKLLIVAFILMLMCFIFSCFAHVHYVNQGQKAFFYDVTSRQEVTEKECPLLPIGLNSKWGWNIKFVEVPGMITDYEFRSKKDHTYDETMQWNSLEGVVMATEYKLYGQVVDPWKFWIHFGEPEYNYQIEKGKNEMVYEALRQAGKNIDLDLNELACTMSAEDLRINPDKIKTYLLGRVVPYMRQFGYEITDLIFMGNMRYPDGNIITEARQAITSLDSDIRQQEQALINLTNQIKIDVTTAKIEANKKVSAAERQASIVKAESQALANALGQSIKQVGVEGTMELKIADLFGTLTKNGTIPLVVLTEESSFSRPFYGNRLSPTNPTAPAVKEFSRK